MSTEDKAIKTSYLSIAGNASLAVIKGVTGYLGNSYALIADAIESTSDIFSSILVLFGLKYSSRPADKNHPYGHGRAETLVTFIVVGFLIASATVIAYESIQNIRTPHALPKPYTLVVLGVIVVIKEIFYRIVQKRSKETGSSSLQADAWHHRSDAITSLTAFVGISVALILGKGYETADDWAALLASGIIYYNGYLIFRPALGELMDEHMYDDMIDEIRGIALTVEGIVDTEKCHVRKSGVRYHVDLHARVDGAISVREGHDIAHRLQAVLHQRLPQLGGILIHIEPA
ncbi:cation diffusion facilitator family transporter [Paraflavisolibacter sp. H34]|uniref:cation diffusion facilitator family transporter n=1 Tax=Huijunlia imazamoxiresistens TaxID=3127457 RepID=UPI003015CD13